MKLPEPIRIQIADGVTRVFALVIILAMLLDILLIWILGEHQYHRMIPAIVAIVAILPGWLLAIKGKPLVGVWFLFACIGLCILSGMIVSGGVRALAYPAVLFCVTPIVALYGVRGGVVFAMMALSVGLLFYRLDTLGVLRHVNEPPAAFLLALIGLYLFIQVGLVWIPVHLMFKALISCQHQAQALNQAVDKKKSVEEHLRQTKRLLEEAQAISKLGGWEYDIATRRLTWTDEVYRIYGMDPGDGKVELDSALSCYSPEHRQIIEQAVRRAIKTGEHYDLELDLIRKDGMKISVRTMGQPIFRNGNVVRVTGNIMDITKRRRAEKELQESEERYRSLVENTIDGHFMCEIPSGKFIFLNTPICALLGYTMPSALALTLWDIIDTEEHDQIRKSIQERSEGKTPSFDNYIRNIIRKNTSKFRAEVSTSLITYKGRNVLQGVLKDITEKEGLILQLQQAQKMEAIGKLAGGVAHDYNNMLSVIMGYSELSLLCTKPGEPIYENLIEICKAAERSKLVTRQLLAFARKEAIAPQMLDLNATIESMLKMIRRLIGENIDLKWHPGKEIGLIRMDPSQIDQILANLCVNAKDAITNVGKITIETSMVTFDADFCSGHVGFIPGDFVMLAVSDNGTGMDKRTLRRIYEPFFTTKEAGQGTGLGMSTVYGIVKQNKGMVDIDSEIDSGTTIRIYFPRYIGEKSADKEKAGEKVVLGHGETVLVVEDEPATLKLVKTFLSLLQYKCLPANNPEEALTLAQSYTDDISLLMTDVIMPGMNGRELSERLKGQVPKIKCLFMSGYTANEIDDHGVLKEGVHFINKPFSKNDLALKIRTVLDHSA